MTDENDKIDEDGIKQRWEQVGSKLDERGRRLWAAGAVQAAGHGALKVVSRITGLARSTINRGEDDLDEGPLPDGWVRRKGGGGKPLIETYPTSSMISRAWSSRQRRARPYSRCDGCRSATRSWRGRWPRWGTRSARAQWA